MNRLFIILLSLILLSLSCSSLRPSRPVVEKGDLPGAVTVLDTIIRNNLRQQRIPGAAVALVHEGRVIFSRCYGYGDTRGKVAITEDTYFMLGSLTKSFTALAVLKLIEQGKIDPNIDIKNYVPGFSIKSLYDGETLITVNHLLAHTSGLMIDYYVHLTGEKKYSNADFLSQLRKEYLCFKPGSACKYSNIGYRLLGLIIEQVTGEQFESYIEKEVFKPLGLNHSSFDYTVDMALHMSKGHIGNTETSRVDNEDKAASGLFSTLKDLTAFLKFLSSRASQLPGGINNDRIIDLIIKNTDPAIDTFYDSKNIYSSGWYLDSYQFNGIHTVLSSSGNINGFSTAMTYLPEERLGIIILTNSSLGWKANMDIIARGLRGLIDATRGPGTRRTDGETQKNIESTAEYESLCGRYVGFGPIVDIFQKKNRLYAKFKGPAALLIPEGDGVFRPVLRILSLLDMDVARFTDYESIRFRFSNNRRGDKLLYMEARLGESTFSLPLHHIQKSNIPKAYGSYYGTWVLDENEAYPSILKLYLPSNRLTFFEKDGWPTIKINTWLGEGLLLLIPLSENLARVAGSGEIVSLNDDTVSYIGLSFKKAR
ncbi:MAG: beta-lactamase [Deltaproteobacteria bacterium]|jgi:CubicO group peptidase (beta-lactamase class C family)|nr:beta-lactamase [Deltaproteobacteria bacterium]